MAPQLGAIGATDGWKVSDMPQLINWDIIKNPINWVIVGLMLYIAVFGLNLIVSAGNGGSLTSATGSAGL